MPHPDKGATPDGNLYDPSHGARVLTIARGLQSLEIIPFKVAAYDVANKKWLFSILRVNKILISFRGLE